jgi:hypothetical protein
MSPLTNALVVYWQRLPAESPAARRRCLESTVTRVREGRESSAANALLPFALGDSDDSIVMDATLAYLEPAEPSGTVATKTLDEAADWVRRGLALNRSAVFAALLCRGDERTLERLAALRLTLSTAEVETACRLLGPAPAQQVVEFLRGWLELLADSPLHRERSALAAAIQGRKRAGAA